MVYCWLKWLYRFEEEKGGHKPCAWDIYKDHFKKRKRTPYILRTAKTFIKVVIF